MNLFSGLKGECLNKEKGILEILDPLSRQEAYHKLFVRKSRITNEHVFVSFVDKSSGIVKGQRVYLCTDGKKYNAQGKCMNNPDLIIKQFVGEWTYKSTK